ncbi:MAG TPA: polysaccharide deacetylase family protein [Kofleriaceae bacterium]|nr:polysaccharide deacetylase family protein [Kofleriaceae bacterium]
MLALWLVVGSAVGFGVVAIAVPYAYVKLGGPGIRRSAPRSDGAIGLSFDDGPDPIATPQILDVLAAAGVRATFFVTGEAADAHPDVMRRLVAEGHEVASHGYRHRHALLQRWPLEGFFDTRKALRRLGGARMYRGPYGKYSWSVLAALRLHRVQPVNWSIEAHDWHPAFTPRDVVAKVVGEARPGAVIVMHDRGRGARRCVAALRPILDGLAAKQLRAMPLSELWS